MTVVVPTKNAARTLGACLESLRAQTYPCRIVVVDNGSTDGTLATAQRWADFVLHAGPERSAQRNVGARAHPADFLGFIDADMVLEPGVVQEAVALLRGGAGSVIVPERSVGTGFWVEVRAFERSFYRGSDVIEAQRFFRREVFERAGGFDELLTGPEDWDLGQAARRLAPVARTGASIAHDEGNLGYLAACHKKAHYAVGVRRYLAKHGTRAFLDASRRPWLSRPWKLANRRGAGLLALKAGEAMTIVAVWGWSAVTVVFSPLTAGNRRSAPPIARSAAQAKGRSGGGRWVQGVLQTGSHLRGYTRGRARVFRAVLHRRSTLGRLTVGILAPGLAGDVTFEGRDGLHLVAPARGGNWLSIVEVVFEDCYRIAGLARELAGSAPQVLDIGAHVGAFSCALARAIPGARVIAVEPSADGVAYLRRNVADNGLEGQVTVVRATIAGQGGRRRLSSHRTLEDTPGKSAGGEWIEVVSFEELLAAVSHTIDLVKIICRGPEYEILGAVSPAALGRIERLVMGYHSPPPDPVRHLFARLAEAGLTERWRERGQPGRLSVVYLSRRVGQP